jgi:hypothetical protein
LGLGGSLTAYTKRLSFQIRRIRHVLIPLPSLLESAAVVGTISALHVEKKKIGVKSSAWPVVQVLISKAEIPPRRLIYFTDRYDTWKGA